MDTGSVASPAGLGGLFRRLSALLTDPPPCALCGRGHASTGWLVDPTGGIHGRCPGCAGDRPWHPPQKLPSDRDQGPQRITG